MARVDSPRSRLIKVGVAEADRALLALDEVSGECDVDVVIRQLSAAPDPDHALAGLVQLARAQVPGWSEIVEDAERGPILMRALGASTAFAPFVVRNPDELASISTVPLMLSDAVTLRASLLRAVGVADPYGEGAPVATLPRDEAIRQMRVAYRRERARIAMVDLAAERPTLLLAEIAASLAHLAQAALEASLAIARGTAAARFGDRAMTLRFAVIGMGKLGAEELNYISDVDVIYVVDHPDDDRDGAIALGTVLAKELQAACMELGREPMLWEVDANLRPEGKQGALVRTVQSHAAYYERWAKSWEFQALLKARHVAGDASLAAEYEDAVRPMVWRSSSRDNFVESVQRMRERVTEHIPADDVDRQLKLGPGGLRDIEFTVQLLQLVHGATDDRVRQRGTLPALSALVDHGYIGRDAAEEFAEDYRVLRVLEHRAQLAKMTRTHLMPVGDEARRAMARAARYPSASVMLERWREVKQRVRGLHEQLFYRPLLAAVAALPEGGTQLTTDQAMARLGATGYRDPKGALVHIAELTAGVSRRAALQRVLLPVLLSWFAEGPDPDAGLLAFRRLSEAVGASPWYLRLLRDSTETAQRLAFVLGTSKLIAALIERIPEAVRWLSSTEQLASRGSAALIDEAFAIVARHRDDPKAAAKALRAFRRREHLRAALAFALGVEDVEASGQSLSAIAAAALGGAVRLLHDAERDGFEFAIVSMGRTGGHEIGFGSDIDCMFVCRALRDDVDAAGISTRMVREIGTMLTDARLPFEIDAGLRPEGRNGPMVRSLDSYRAYYARWSESWEAQALLRARPLVGDAALLTDMMSAIDAVRYPNEFPLSEQREVRRIKARVEAERLPKNADPTRHLKLGRGSLSDVEWLVQLLQLRFAACHEVLQVTGTLDALAGLGAEGLLDAREVEQLREAWLLASSLRSALALAQARTVDLLPTERHQLDTVARLLGKPAGSAAELEDEYLRVTRRARRVFDRRFFA